MKKIWYSIKTIIYGYTIQYLLAVIGIIIFLILTDGISTLNNQNYINTLYEFTFIIIALTSIPISIYLYKKYKTKESKIKLNKLLPMIPLGLSISLFYNMLTIHFQPESTLLELSTFTLILYVVISAPIFEEILFRYVSLRRTKEHYQEKTSIIIISLIFALMHSGLINIIYAFLIGIILSIIYIKYKNIIYPITIHISANLMSIFISKFNLLALIISGVVLLLTILYLRKNNHS